MNSLKTVNLRNERQVEKLEIKSRDNNLIFRGIARTADKSCTQLAGDFCREVLKVDINDNIHAFPLGPATITNNPLLVSFIRQQDKLAVLSSTKVLKNSGFVVHCDLPETIRRKRVKLLLLRKQIMRLNSHVKCSLRSDSLIIEGQRFQWCNHVGVIASDENALQKLNALVGHDLTEFVAALLNDNLPKDYFYRTSTQPSANSAHRFAQSGGQRHS